MLFVNWFEFLLQIKKKSFKHVELLSLTRKKIISNYYSKNN